MTRYSVEIVTVAGMRPLKRGYDDADRALAALLRYRKRHRVKTGWVRDNNTGEGIVPAGEEDKA